MVKKMRLSYPMMSWCHLWVDHRKDKVYELAKLESELKKIYY